MNARNRGVYIANNIKFLTKLDDECIDLVCIDPPFGRDRAFKADGITPPLTAEEEADERHLLKRWGIDSADDAKRLDIDWPYSDQTEGGFDDRRMLRDPLAHFKMTGDYSGVLYAFRGVAEHSRGELYGMYLTNIATRLMELHRVLKRTGSLYVHSDSYSNAYIRIILDTIFGADNFRGEVIWSYGLGGSSSRTWSAKHDTVFFYSKSDEWYFDKPTEAATSQMLKGQQKGMTDVWPMGSLNNMAFERTGYPTQKPVALGGAHHRRELTTRRCGAGLLRRLRVRAGGGGEAWQEVGCLRFQP